MNKLYIPSFEFEKKTKALNKYILFFVLLISMFTIDVVVIPLSLCISSISDITFTFVSENLLIILLIIPVLFIISSFQLYLFLSNLLTSYKFNGTTIIKGKIKKGYNHIPGSDLKTVSYNMYNIYSIIKLNLNKEFVELNFDTDMYKKKEYKNVSFVKETKYSLIYKSGNKKIRIPKIYEGMFEYNVNTKSVSFIKRVLLNSLSVFIISLIFIIIDLFIGSINNNEYITNINKTIEKVESNLIKYGYELKKNSDTYYSFRKENKDKTSEIKYYMNKDGNIQDVVINLYYKEEVNEDEIRYILSTYNDTYKSDDIDLFIEKINNSINGNYEYYKLKSESGTNNIIISLSDGYIDIHEYN